MNQQPFRLPPKLRSHQYKTYAIRSPLSTHFRPATCQEFGCEAYEKGWSYKKSDLDERLLYIVTHAGKRYREMDFDGAAYLVFEPGQACFQASMHKVSLERPEIYIAGRGDHRSFSARRAQQFKRPEDWTDSFAHHLDAIRKVREEG